MKRSTISLIMAMLTVCSLSGRQISPVEAMALATDFMNNTELQSVTHGSKALRPMRAPGVEANAAESPYYVFNRGEANGFVIISGDDRAPKILGYSDKGSFDADNLPPQLKAMMEQWATQMAKLPATAPQHASWTATASTRSGEGILMETAEWGQGYPYNALCPVIDGEQAPAGCVATAMAIAMKYHNWPDYTRGGIQEDFNYPEFTFDFDDYIIDWNVLEDKTNPKFASEVSKLMYTTGVTAQMMYGPYESSAEMWPLGHKMIELYTYAKGCQYIEKEKFSDEEWYRMLVEQLQEVGPVIYRGSGSIGHAFVIDGFDGDSLFHVNWGWDGLLNGYYTLDFSDVGGSNFSEYQGMVINIRPDKQRKEYSKSFVPNCDVYIGSTNNSEGLNFYSPDITPGENTKFKLPTITINGHVGYYDIAVVDEDDNILQILDMGGFNNDPVRHCANPGMTIEMSAVFPGLKPGQRYQAVSMDAELDENGYSFATPRSEDPKDWKLILGGMIYPSHFYDHGNRSVISEVHFHIDEDMPIAFPTWMTQEREFTLYKLRGGACPENILIPSKGVTMDIKCTDKNGNPEEVYSVGSVDDNGIIGLNISMYSDIFDVYIKYDYDGDTRKDRDISADNIIVEDGLVYKIVDNGVSLIGYDNIESDVTIPETITYEGNILPVIKVENDALLFAPIKNLTIKNSAPLGVFAFGGMENIESVSFEEGIPDPSWYQPFRNSKVKNVYFDSIEQTILMNSIIGLSWNWYPGEFGYASIHNDDIDFYVSEVGSPNDIGEGVYTSNIYTYGISIALGYGWIEKALNSYNIPGIGTGDIISNPIINIRQMWDYAIDRKHDQIKIKPLIDEIKITSVIVNGTEIAIGKDFIYNVPSTDNMEVVVNYVLNGNKEMSSVYSAEYNANLPDSEIEVSLIPVESVTVSQTSSELKVGESVALTATVFPETATDKTVTWSSDNEAVATVDGNGNVTAVALGTATITATCGSVSATCVVTVVATPVENILLSFTDYQIKAGESFNLAAFVYPEDSTDKTVTWTSDNESVAIVDDNGNVTGIAVGEAIITASCGSVSATCNVTVVETEAQNIVLSEETARLKIGETFVLTATVYPEDTTDKTVTWTSDNEAVAIVDGNGNVTAVGIGEAYITAHCGHIGVSCHVLVIETQVETILLTPDSWNGEEGESFRIEATVMPEDATDKAILWTSSDETVATVDAEGNVSVLKEGSCVITATAADGSGVSAECIITSAAGVEGIFSEAENFDVYEVNGILVKKEADRDALKALTPGIYIIRQGSTIKKLVIR